MKERKYVRQLVLAAVAVCTVVVSVMGQAGWNAANPIISHKYTADPQPIVWRNRLYVYASFDDLNRPNWDYRIPSYTLVSTNDMANWTDHGEVFVGQRDWGRGVVYAPGAAVMRDSVFLYPCGAGGPTGVVRSATPYGPWNSPLPNNRALVDNNSCDSCRSVWAFDPGAFVDDNGRVYLYYGGGGPNDNPGPGRNLKGVELNSDMISLRGGAQAAARTIPAPFSFEAAYMHKHNGTYYFSYSTNFATSGGIPGGSIEYMTSNNPLTGFTHRGTMLANPASFNSEWGGNNHHGTIQYENQWYIFYHDRRVKVASNGEHNDLRSIGVARLTHNANGTLQAASMLDNPPRIRAFNPYDTIWAATMNGAGSSLRNAIRTEESTVRGRMILVPLANNSRIRLRGVNFGTAGANRLVVRAANANATGSIEIRRGNPTTGTILGTFNIPRTTNRDTFVNTEFELNRANFTGMIDSLYLVFRGTGTELFRLAWYQFHGGTVTPSHMVTVNGGTGGGSMAVGSTVTITATVPSGMVFDRWTAPPSAGVTFASATNATTTFTMPNNAVTVTATFRCPMVNPDANGYFFYHTFENNTTQGWEGRHGPTVANTNTHAANGSRSLLVSGRTADWQGVRYDLNVCTFVPGNTYSFSGLAMYADGPATSTFKLTLQYELGNETVWHGIDSVQANRDQWVMLQNRNFAIPAGATGLVIYVEMPGNSTSSFYIDDMMGGVAGTPGPGAGAVSVADRSSIRNALPLGITVRSNMLTVNAHSDEQVRVADVVIWVVFVGIGRFVSNPLGYCDGT